LAVISIPIAALLLIVFAFLIAQRHNQQADAWIHRLMMVDVDIQTVRTRWEMAETGMLGYVTTEDAEWLQPIRQARQELPAIFERLGKTVETDSQREHVRTVEQRVLDRLDRLEELPARAEAFAAARDRAKLLSVARSEQDAIRHGLVELRQEQERLVRSGEARQQAATRRAYVAVAVGVIVALAGGVLAMVLFTNTITRRVEVLDDNARRLVTGVPVAPLEPGSDEIGRLAQSLGETATLLAERQRDLRDSAAALEGKVQDRTAELERANRALAAEIGVRNRTEAELADAKQRVEAVINASPLAIIGLEPDGRVLGWNRAAEDLFGWTAEEVLGQKLPTIPDDQGDAFTSLLSQLNNGHILTAHDARRRRRDGTVVDVRIWTAPLTGPDGAMRGQIGVIADITSQRKLEQQFAHAQKMEAIGRLAGGVAHDFNNVITVISGYAQMLLEDSANDPARREAAEEILNSADRAAGLAGQLLAFSRRQVIQPRVMDVNALVSDMQRMLGRVIGEDIELKTVLRQGLGAVRADPGQLEQVIMNLAVNARDAMPNGGRLVVETADAVLDESYAQEHAGVKPGRYVMIAVSDTGTGMDEHTRAHLFEPFFTTKERGKGTGLGLSTVYGIVKQHGGDIWVYSEQGKGSTFKIYLPQADPAAADPEEARPRQRAARNGHETILVVEDEDGLRRLVREVLEQRGYNVLAARSGAEALDLAASAGRIDLLLTDVVMPKMNGRELAEALATTRPALPVLYLSGYTDEMVTGTGILSESAEFLQKPFTPEKLARRIRDILDRPAKAR
jgi:PAS domain S-box-containing protein